MSKIKVVFLLVLVSFLNINCMKNKNKQGFKFLKDFNICEKGEEISQVAVDLNSPLVAVAKGKKVEVWDIGGNTKGSERKIFAYEHKELVEALVFFSNRILDNRVLLASYSSNMHTNDAEIKILSLGSHKTGIRTFSLKSKFGDGRIIIKFSPDKKYVVVGSYFSSILYIGDLMDSSIKELDVGYDVENFIFSGDSKWIAISGGKFSSEVLWDDNKKYVKIVDLYFIGDGTFKRIFKDDQVPLGAVTLNNEYDLALSSDNRYLIGGSSLRMFLYDVLREKIVHTKHISKNEAIVTRIFFNDDKQILLLVNNRDKAYICTFPEFIIHRKILDAGVVRFERDLMVTPDKKYWSSRDDHRGFWSVLNLDKHGGTFKRIFKEPSAAAETIKTSFLEEYGKMVSVEKNGLCKVYKTQDDLYFSSQSVIQQRKAKDSFLKLLGKNKNDRKFTDLKVVCH